MTGFWFSNVQKRKAQKQMETMLKDVECLQEAEKHLTGLQSRSVSAHYIDGFNSVPRDLNDKGHVGHFGVCMHKTT